MTIDRRKRRRIAAKRARIDMLAAWIVRGLK